MVKNFNILSDNYILKFQLIMFNTNNYSSNFSNNFSNNITNNFKSPIEITNVNIHPEQLRTSEYEILNRPPSQTVLLINGKVLIVCASDFDTTKPNNTNPKTIIFFMLFILKFSCLFIDN